MTKIVIYGLFIRHENLIYIDCILNPRKVNSYFAGKLGKLNSYFHYTELSKNPFLIAALEDHEPSRRCEVFIKCSVVDEEDNKTRETEIKKNLLIALLQSNMVVDVT